MFGFTRRWVLVSAVLAACARAKPADEPPPRAPPAPVIPSAQTEPAAAPDRTPLAQRLAQEASDHPAAVAEVDARLAALTTAGLRLSRTRQVLASPLRAHYCKTALSEAGLALSLCAFESEPDARAGLRRSRDAFDRLIPGRSLMVNGSVLLTVTRASVSEAERERELLLATFNHPTRAERAAL